MCRPAAVLLALGCLLLAGCGSGTKGVTPSTTSATSSPAPPAGSLEALWRSAKQNVAVVEGSSDYQPGSNRVSFLVVDPQSRVITTPTATIWVSTGLKSTPYERTIARSEPIGVPGGESAGVGSIFVTHVRLPRPGKYWLLAIPVGGTSISALGNLVVGKTSDAPAVGARAIPSNTPTLASTHGKLSALSTATHPDPRLYRLSVAQALTRHVPFVLTFATPKFCQSRTCGPVVDVVDAVARKLAATPVRFIHVEIYRNNDSAKGFNRWVKQWNLPN